MSPELKQAVEERVALGHTKEQIASELQAAGYDDQSIEAIYAAVTSDDSVSTPPSSEDPSTPASAPSGSLIGYGALIKDGFALAASQWKVFVLTFLYQVAAIILFAISFGLIFGLLTLVPGGAIISVLVGLALFILYFAVAIILIGAMLRAVLLRSEGDSFSSHIGWMQKRMWSGVGVALLQQFVISNALYVLYFMIAVFAAVAFSSITSFDPSSIERSFNGLFDAGGTALLLLLFGVIFGYLVMLITVLVLTAYAGWAMLTFVSGRAKGIASLTESAVLVNGRVLPVFWRLLFFGALAFVFMFVIAIVLALFDLSAQASENVSSIVQLLFIPFLVSTSVLLYESLRSTEQPVTDVVRQKINTRVKVGVWTGGVAMLLYFFVIAAVVFFVFYLAVGMFGGLNGNTDVPTPTQFQTEQTELNADMQAELEAFQEEFQAEFEAN